MRYHMQPITMIGWVEDVSYKKYSFTCEMKPFLIYRLDEIPANAYEEFAEELAEQGFRC